MTNYKKATISSYNKTAKEYFEVVSKLDMRSQIQEFSGLVEPNGRVLDLGCGPGQHAKIFNEAGFDVVGIDLSEKMIEIARVVAPDANFKVMDMAALTFPPNSFDGIWASASLLHIPRNEIKPVLQSLYAILRSKGALYISLKSGDSEDFFNDHRYGGVRKFYVYYTPDEIEAILVDLNFKILHHGLGAKRLNYDTNSWIYVFCVKA